MNKGKYLYCVANSGLELDLGKIGINKAKVFTIPHKGICAVVHNYYNSLDCEDVDKNVKKVKSWLNTHQTVIEIAAEKLGTVLPFAFGKIINGDNKVVKKWLGRRYAGLFQKINSLRGMQEYGIQISCNPESREQKLMEVNLRLKELSIQTSTSKVGMAYMRKEQLKRALKRELEKEADYYFRDFYEQIKGYVADVKVEKVKPLESEQMILNISCLVNKNLIEELGAELKKIDNMSGFNVRFTGPWPPYSFV